MPHTAAFHRAILIVDVEGFSDPDRTNTHQLAIRKALYKALMRSLADTRIGRNDYAIEDRGDGALLLILPVVPKISLACDLPVRLADNLATHNAVSPAPEQIRLRMALHAGEVLQDAHGFTGASLNLAFRLIEAPEPKVVLRDSPGIMVLIVSTWFYDEVVWHDPAAKPECFREIPVDVKETKASAWVRVLETGRDLEQPVHAAVVVERHRIDRKYVPRRRDAIPVGVLLTAFMLIWLTALIGLDGTRIPGTTPICLSTVKSIGQELILESGSSVCLSGLPMHT